MPRLTVQLAKRDPKPALLICTRADGSRTIGEAIVGPYHDLAHVAVESVLRLRHAFFGMVADGVDLAEFDQPGATAALDFHPEAAYAEHLVNLLQTELGATPRPHPECIAELNRSLRSSRKPGVPPPDLPTATEIALIREHLADLWTRWLALPRGEHLEVALDL